MFELSKSRRGASRAVLALAMSFAAMSVAACGGGGSSGGGGGGGGASPPPPPPPAGNAAPVIRYEVSTPNLFEQAIFVIDADETRDAESDSFELTMRQVGGPTAERMEDINAYAKRWRAPDVETNSTEQMVFEIRAEDDRGAVSTVTVRLDFLGVSGPGKPVALLEPGARLEVGNIGTPGTRSGGLSEVIASVPDVAGSPSNPRSLFMFGNSEYQTYFDYSQTDLVSVEATFSDIQQLLPSGLSFNGVRARDNFIVLEEKSGQLSLVASERTVVPGGTFERITEADLDNPCFVRGRTSTGQDFIWVGKRDGGFSVLRFEAIDADADATTDELVTEPIFEFQSDRSLCHIFPTLLPESIYVRDWLNESNFPPLITVDFDTNELVMFGDIDETQRYVELAVLPLQTQSTAKLNIVDVFSFGNDSLKPRYLAVLLTDGKSGGEHRLVVVSQDNFNEEISQKTFAWSGGVPVSLVQGSYVGLRPGDQTRRDFVVVSDSGEALVFENTVPDDKGVATEPTYAEPAMFAIAPGAGSAVNVNGDNFNDNVIMVAYPETGLVRTYRPVDELSE